MIVRRFAWLAVVAGAVPVVCRAAEPTREGLDFFEKKIRPVLVAQCYKCHSAEAEKIKGGLRVDTRDGLLKGGESGPALVAGRPEQSLLIQALRHDGLEMPPDKKLADTVLADFTAWVKMGAPDPRVGTAVANKPEPGVETKPLWSLKKPVQPPVPKTSDKAWPRSDVDRFVLAGLEHQKMLPVADADRRTLVRRLYFDLTGLPPSPEEMARVLGDASPKAIENLVDRLLASPQFGERWGRHWLDVARFAESNGNADNNPYPHAWRYRDYVIRSFNADKPYDRFVTEQMAGDLLPAGSPRERDELLVATGFLALGSKPRAQNNPDYQMDVVAEQIEVATSGIMALTVVCARCHDHKFDPIPTSEYYAMAGIFTSSRILDGGAARTNRDRVVGGLHTLTGDDPERIAARKAYEEQVAAVRTGQQEAQAELAGMEKKKLAEPGSAATDDRRAKKKVNAKRAAGPTPPTPYVATSKADEAATARIKELNRTVQESFEKLQALEKSAPPGPDVAMGAGEGSSVADCAICLRGDSQKRGETVARGFVQAVPVTSPPTIPAGESGRLQLAQWMTSPENPLTARVIVNRIWHHLMGRAIVPSLDNFGHLGEAPSHPELLDHLALRFVADGWSIKKTIRALVLTRTYQLSSAHDARNYERDPDNAWCWRHPARRLDAESIRDALLATSGRLDLSAPDRAAAPATDTRGRIRGANDASASSRHRSVYLTIYRNALPEALELFDFADPSLVVGVRDVTTVPAQSLFLMNSPFVVQQSQSFAQRSLEAGGDGDAARLRRMYETAFGRVPTDDETRDALAFLQKFRAAEGTVKSGGSSESRAWSVLAQGLLSAAEFRYVQ